MWSNFRLWTNTYLINWSKTTLNYKNIVCSIFLEMSNYEESFFIRWQVYTTNYKIQIHSVNLSDSPHLLQNKYSIWMTPFFILLEIFFDLNDLFINFSWFKTDVSTLCHCVWHTPQTDRQCGQAMLFPTSKSILQASRSNKLLAF